MPTDSTKDVLVRRTAYALAVAGDIATRASRRMGDRASAETLEGDRWVEWSFCMARLADGDGMTLDFGGDVGFLSLAAAQRGHDVSVLDRLPTALAFRHPRVTSHVGDILDRPLADRRFDQIINCSSVEHVGLSGRYGNPDRPDGDIEAMGILRDMLAPGGRMILTVPVGRDAICAPFHRIYGRERLPRLIGGYREDEAQYWAKRGNAWEQVERDTALDAPGSASFYSLGLFVLSSADR